MKPRTARQRPRTSRRTLPALLTLCALPLVMAGTCNAESDNPLVEEGELAVTWRFTHNSNLPTHMWVGTAADIGPTNQVAPGGTGRQDETYQVSGNPVNVTVFAGRSGAIFAQRIITLPSSFEGETRNVNVAWNESTPTVLTVTGL